MLTLWNGFDRSFSDELRRMDRLFNTRTHATGLPRVDIEETATALELIAEVPGMTSDDVTVSLHDGVLKIEGAITHNEESEDRKVLRRERRHMTFSRTFRLGIDVDRDSVTASVKDGVLTVTLPKQPEAQPKRIAVN